jgi:trehalose-phosphatase
MTDPPPHAPAGARLDALLAAIARTPHLLIASDYDGTVAPIVENPALAHPVREAIVALRALAELPRTDVAIVSGRALADLARLTGLPPSVHLVGSHGSEFDPGFASALTMAQRELRLRLAADLRAIATAHPGCTVEEKPASVAFHVRNADARTGDAALSAVAAGPAAIPGVHIKQGKMVIELAVLSMNKATALDTIRARTGATAAIFFGDDVTDEDVFLHLRGPDLSIKVGPGDTAAEHRIADPAEVARLLARLAGLRSEWLCGADAVPIEHHALLSDQRTIALVTPRARIVWMCAPRLDSPAIFAELLGGPGAGRFSVAPDDGAEPISQSYVGDTLTLTTEFPACRVTDFLDCSAGLPNQRAGRTDLVRTIGGAGRVRIEFAPRLDFGRMPTKIQARENGLEVLGSPEPMVLWSPGVQWTIAEDGHHHTASATVALTGDPLTLVLRCGGGTMRASTVHPIERGRETMDFWSSWVAHLRPPAEHRDAVVRSALLLRGLQYGPTGAIAAAATTSLPEWLGGVRNWDYRYCWPRDAAIAARSLAALGSSAEGMRLLDWLLGVLEREASPGQLAPLYTLSGHEAPSEGEIGELPGYAGSRPVRIGNAAARQVQLDVFGPIVDLVHTLAERDAPLSPHHWRVAEAMVEAVSLRWEEPDHGIWEVRDAKRHHVHSKVMCWVTVDRALKASVLLRDREPESWIALRDRIGTDILDRGWSKKERAFTSAYDSDAIDASTLWVGLSGLIAPDDERFRSTIDAVRRTLMAPRGVYRYRFDDNLPGAEGVFNLCTCWMIQSLALSGNRDEAEAMFADYLALAGQTGLMPEEADPESGRGLGNTPQAYSHAGLIDCAMMLG